VRPDAIAEGRIRPRQLIDDLCQSREHGLAHIDQLVREWTPRIPLPPETIRHYLTHNIHYTLTPECRQSIHTFRTLAAEAGVLPALPELRFLDSRSSKTIFG
jgi:chorismate dehydratase